MCRCNSRVHECAFSLSSSKRPLGACVMTLGVTHMEDTVVEKLGDREDLVRARRLRLSSLLNALCLPCAARGHFACAVHFSLGLVYTRHVLDG